MVEDPRTRELFAQALSYAALAARDTVPASHLTQSDKVRLAAAQTIATGTIFAALVESDLANQLRAARAELPTKS